MCVSRYFICLYVSISLYVCHSILKCRVYIYSCCSWAVSLDHFVALSGKEDVCVCVLTRDRPSASGVLTVWRESQLSGRIFCIPGCEVALKFRPALWRSKTKKRYSVIRHVWHLTPHHGSRRCFVSRAQEKVGRLGAANHNILLYQPS